MSGKIIEHLAIEENMSHNVKENKWMEIIFHILTMVVLFLEIHSHFPSEPMIRLEVEKSDTPSAAYSLIGADSDQDYSLEYLKIYPRLDSDFVKQATFQYNYYKEVDLKESQIEQPTAYIISRELLQKEFGEEGFHFAFLSENNHFQFNFLFEDSKQNEPQFECQAVAMAENVGQIINIPCKVGKKVPVVYRKMITVLGVEIFVWEIGIAIMVLLWYFGFLIFLKKPRKESSTTRLPTHGIGEEVKPPRDGEGTF
ncbi:MAG: hypothetical protein DRR19_23505 [Candidatus Parabeggiatoa sp. nov. 1]|nr:MAG: hypothetical protein DRR19_23505 [Gammaproteobacteria bacterium]